MIEDFKKFFDNLGGISFENMEAGFELLFLFDFRYWWLEPSFRRDLRTMLILDGTYIINKIEDSLQYSVCKVNKPSVLRSLK